MTSAVRECIGEQPIDDAFTDLARDDSGRAVCRLTAPDGATVELWVDENYPFMELFTGDTLTAVATAHGSRRRADDVRAKRLPER